MVIERARGDKHLVDANPYKPGARCGGTQFVSIHVIAIGMKLRGRQGARDKCRQRGRSRPIVPSVEQVPPKVAMVLARVMAYMAPPLAGGPSIPHHAPTLMQP
ncbi:hypothetical protein XFLAVUS301_10230 [Xanthobacter flavus]|uniref:Uncharacterized protein n=1 Tax=Xanthobacter flavus TaxID=281 RepID=A0A9W6CIH4_XANFL|nr:hypothetical protein XFLAVUS301_10230 [Xanthobacter flavus]